MQLEILIVCIIIYIYDDIRAKIKENQPNTFLSQTILHILIPRKIQNG